MHICAFQYMASAQTKQCRHITSALLISAQHKMCLVLFDLQFHYKYFRLRLLQQQIWFQLTAVVVSPCPSASVGINMFWRQNCNIKSLQLSDNGFSICGFQYTDAGGILSGSYPLLNKDNIVWSISRLQVNF